MCMAEPHCSKCCPVKPPAPPAPFVPPMGVYLWGAAAVVGVVGGWVLIVWMGSVIWP